MQGKDQEDVWTRPAREGEKLAPMRIRQKFRGPREGNDRASVRRQDDPPLRTSAAMPPRAIRMALMKASTFSSESRTTTGSLKSGSAAVGKSFIATATTPVSRLIAPTVSKAWGRNSLPVISCPSLFVVIFNSPFMVGIVYLTNKKRRPPHRRGGPSSL